MGSNRPHNQKKGYVSDERVVNQVLIVSRAGDLSQSPCTICDSSTYAAREDVHHDVTAQHFSTRMPSFFAKCALFALAGVFALVEPAHAAASDGMCEYLSTSAACESLVTSAMCSADTRCEWPSTASECYVKGDYVNEAIFNAALAKTDAFSVEYKKKMEACEAVNQQSSCSSANDCTWDSTASECYLSDGYTNAFVVKCAASSASTSSVAFQALLAAATAAALLA